MKRMAMFVAALLALGAGVASAAVPSTTDYLRRTSPMISGTVSSVGDRQIVVDTDQGEQVTLVMDSRTMLPTDLAPGMVMKAEFRVMENGQYYVTRIIPVRDAKKVQESEAYWQHRNRDWDVSRASTTRVYAPAAEPAAIEQTERAGASEPQMAADASTASHRPETLPQTASQKPLIGLLGLLALSGAGALMLTRRLGGA